MKKSQLRNIIRESIKQLMTEQSWFQTVHTQPFFDITNTVGPQTQTGVTMPFIQRMITKIPYKHTIGKGCQFICNRLDILINKLNNEIQNHGSGFVDSNHGGILLGKINYLNYISQNYVSMMCQVFPLWGNFTPCHGDCSSHCSHLYPFTPIGGPF
jgi:hypothetical protein